MRVSLYYLTKTERVSLVTSRDVDIVTVAQVYCYMRKKFLQEKVVQAVRSLLAEETITKSGLVFVCVPSSNELYLSSSNKLIEKPLSTNIFYVLLGMC